MLSEKQRNTKLNEVKYSDLKPKPNLKDHMFSKEERTLLTSLRSRCYNAKSNFKKLYKNYLNCMLGCDLLEIQNHVFTQCNFSEIPPNLVYDDIFGDSIKQKEVITSLMLIEKEERSFWNRFHLGKPGPGHRDRN